MDTLRTINFKKIPNFKEFSVDTEVNHIIFQLTKRTNKIYNSFQQLMHCANHLNYKTIRTKTATEIKKTMYKHKV